MTEGTAGGAEDYEDLFEHAPCGYLSLGPDGRIFKVNATFCAWTGFTASDVAGKHLHDFLNIAGRIYYETHFAPLLRMQGHFNEVALDFLTKDGARLPVLVNAQERKSPSGEVLFIRVTVFNSTDRRRYERELLEAKTAADAASTLLRDLNATLEARVEKEVVSRVAAEDAQRQMQKIEAIGRLTGGIAHDFNNMLAVVIGSINLTRRRLAKGQDVDELLVAGLDGANRAAELTKRLLAFSRQLPLEQRVVSVNRMVSDMSEILRRTIGEAIRVETVLAGGLWPVRTDSSELENVVLNLAINARDAMPDGGRITIESANTHLDDAYASEHAEVVPGQYVMIAVTDTGIGMSPDTMTKAFEPFFSTKEVGKGTGLGLSQVFGYVKQAGGHVKIYSELNHGTTVKIYLPRHFGDVETPDADIAPAQIRAGAGEHVLLVEDDERMRTIAAASLRELGYVVTSAAGPEEALKHLRSDATFALLFTDIVMPVMNGRRLADEALTFRPGLRVVFTTGFTRNAVVHNGVLDPGVYFLPKPYTLDQLAAKIREALA